LFVRTSLLTVRSANDGGRTTVLRNPDHVTIAVSNATTAIEFFELLGFRKQHVATIDGGLPAQYMDMPDMKAQHITLALEGCEPRFEIQLLEFDPTPPDDPGEHPTNRRRRGYNHVAFRVDDIGAVTTHLVANGSGCSATRWTTSVGVSGSSRVPRGSPSSWCSGSAQKAAGGESPATAALSCPVPHPAC
jgi:catechol 2,3-dioxygenase-like lactoylglutathione lyase family enzyme